MIERLLHGSAFPHPVHDLALHETHISWVVLTGDYAYKIKKPVNLGFVDFSTLARRKKFCEQEYRLNSAFSPHLYVGVLEIRELPNGSILVGADDGLVVDYAVKMHQFDQAALFSDMLLRDRLEVRHVEALAGRIADIHRNAPHADRVSGFGSATQIQYWSDENLEQIGRRLTDPATRSRIETLRQSVRALQCQYEALFEARRHGGFVRDCHGDLHLGNILWLRGQAQVFDRIEFNDELRWIDVINDIAFTAMDFFHMNRADLGWCFINRYLGESGDYDGAVLLGFFMSYRALVRAKVALLAAGDDAASMSGAYAGFTSHLDLAEGLVNPREPTLVITCGLSGSGKTTQALRRIPDGAIVIRSDVERKRMAGLGAHESSGDSIDSGIYSPEMNRRVYDRLLDLANKLLESGFSVVIDAAFLRRAERDRFRTLARRRRVDFELLYCHASPEELRKRIVDRLEKDSVSEATLAVLERQIATAELPDDEEILHLPGSSGDT
jgi:uncharacterized protein